MLINHFNKLELNNVQIKLVYFIFLFTLSPSSNACEKWFNNLNIKDHQKCESICRTSITDMSSFGCVNECNKLCKKLTKNPETLYGIENMYALTDDEISFCKKNKINCIKAYKESWNAEKICLSIYPTSNTNDESDACRHYVWAILLSREIGEKDAATVLAAHENNPRELQEQKDMDTKNNQIGLDGYQKNKDKFTSDEVIKQSFIDELKRDKFIILKQYYSNTGGTP